MEKINKSAENALFYKTPLYKPTTKGNIMHSKNWFELIQKIILTALGYLAGVYL